MNDTERAIEITGGSAETLSEALDQWENERQALGELFDENQALTISFRQYDITMKFATQIMETVENEAAMFLTEKTRAKIATFHFQMQELEKRRAADRQNVTDSNNRRNPHVQTSRNP
jgi:hypothetical protein